MDNTLQKEAEVAYPQFEGPIQSKDCGFSYGQLRNSQQLAYIAGSTARDQEIERLREALEQIRAISEEHFGAHFDFIEKIVHKALSNEQTT